jgi:hypothetical protein
MLALVEADGFACAVALTVTDFSCEITRGAVYEIGNPLGHAGTLVAVTAGTSGM